MTPLVVRLYFRPAQFLFAQTMAPILFLPAKMHLLEEDMSRYCCHNVARQTSSGLQSPWDVKRSTKGYKFEEKIQLILSVTKLKKYLHCFQIWYITPQWVRLELGMIITGCKKLVDLHLQTSGVHQAGRCNWPTLITNQVCDTCNELHYVARHLCITCRHYGNFTFTGRCPGLKTQLSSILSIIHK